MAGVGFAAALVLTYLLLGGGGSTLGSSVAADGRSPRVPAANRVRVLVDLKRPSLGERMASERLDPGAQRAHVASLQSEAEALLSALRAKDVETARPVLYSRAWSGFAVTLETGDLPAVQGLGLRSEPVRRFFGATTSVEPGRLRRTASRTSARGGRPTVALLDSGVDRRIGSLRDSVVPVYDAVGRDRDPAPSGGRERHGTAMAGVLAAELPEGARFASIRVAGRQRDAEGAPELEVATTDQLLAGLERAVDPDADGDTEDRIPIALVGVSSPYSGFDDSPEAESARAAAAIGTLVVAPAGNEGEAAGSYGTMGSPGAAPATLAVGALDGGGPGTPAVALGIATEEGRAKLDGALLGGGGRAFSARVTPLGGRTQAAPRGGGRSAGGDPLEYLGVDASAKAAGRVVVVPARAGDNRPSIAQRAVAASGAGAVALVVCDPDADVPGPPLPVGAADGIAVIGLAGDDAERALELTESPGGQAFVSEPRARDARGRERPAEASSRGPTYALAPKPDLVAPGTAESLAPGGGAVVASGSSVAAARVAAVAERVRRAAPRLDARELAAALVGTARPAGAQLAAGAGRPNATAASTAPALAEPRMVGFPPPPGGSATVTLSNPGTRAVELRLSAALGERGLRAVPARERVRLAPGARRRVELRLEGTTKRTSGFATGALTARARGGARGQPPASVTVPLLVPLGTPPPPALGRLATIQREGRVSGVRFSLGAVRRQASAVAVEPLGSLTLAIVDPSGAVARELTPPGGAPDLLPGEYSYTLPANTELDPGEYRFRVTARSPTGGTATAQSDPFTLR